MTLDEAIEILEKNKPLRVFGYENLCDAYDVAIEALEKEDKYRWHDLRKNPNDLPSECDVFAEEEKSVLIKCNNGKTYVACYVTFQGTREPMWQIQYQRTYKESQSKVIAWKEIEPFEVTE